MSKKDKKKPEFVLEKMLFSLLRKAFKVSPQYHEALNRAKEEFFVLSKNGKEMRRIRFKCNICQRSFLPPESKKKVAAREGIDVSEVKRAVKAVAIDHITPVISLEHGFQGWDVYIQRLFCHVENLQCICNYSGLQDGKESCHKLKTRLESQQRKRLRKKQKV
jgi:hypothetical protein